MDRGAWQHTTVHTVHGVAKGLTFVVSPLHLCPIGMQLYLTPLEDRAKF